MRRLLLASPLALSLIAPAALAQDAPLANSNARASYAIGLGIGESMAEDGVPLDTDAFLRGVKDALSGAKPALTDAEMDTALRQLQVELAARRLEKVAAIAEANAKEGEAFLAANRAKPGVVTTASGLQYEVVRAGTGPRPTAADTVRVHYRGALLDGTVFDSSEGRGPTRLEVGGVIPGWQEALPMMSVGSTWRLFIPPELAYGPRGAGADIGPNETLVFEVELLGIE